MKRYLHVLNGYSLMMSFRKSGIQGKVVVWAEALYDGPIPSGASPEEWRQVRAHHYSESMGFGSVAENLRGLASWDAPLERFRRFDEVILWLEHDLFDQLLLIRHLDWFSRQERGDTRLSLICIDRFPGMPRFQGLATLNSAKVATLFGTQAPVTPEQFLLGRAAWSAFGAPDPRAIEAILAGDTSPLPFLADAFRRHLSEFPSVRNGLSKAESEALAKMSDGPVKPSWICGDWLTRHDDAWMGDATFFALLRALAKGPNPLIEPVTPLESEDRIVFQATEHRLTDLGRRVVAGQADRVAECGIDRHLGGVHLRGHDVAWRWDEAAGRLIHRPT